MDPADRDTPDDVPHDAVGDDGHGATNQASSAPLPDEPRLERARDLLERGDNKAARRLLESIEDAHVTGEVRTVRDEMLQRTSPDRFALGVFFASAILVIVVAWLAFRHSAGV